MSVENIEKAKTGKQICEWIYLGMLVGIRRAAEDYENLKAQDLTEAIRRLKRGIDLPNRARARMDKYISDNNPGALTYLGECISLYACGGLTVENEGAPVGVTVGFVTIGEVNSALSLREAYCLDIRDQIVAETMTWDQASASILAAIERIEQKLDMPFPDDYIDIWGE